MSSNKTYGMTSSSIINKFMTTQSTVIQKEVFKSKSPIGGSIKVLSSESQAPIYPITRLSF